MMNPADCETIIYSVYSGKVVDMYKKGKAPMTIKKLADEEYLLLLDRGEPDNEQKKTRVPHETSSRQTESAGE
jgi:hypothetical protein